MTRTLGVLGDSIAYGQGASRADDTIGERLRRVLAADGTPVDVRVHAVPGARSSGLSAQVARAGRLDVALVVIGANDVTHFVPVEQAAEQLAQAVRALRAAGAQVVVAPAPDLSAVPFLPVQFRPLARAASERLRAAQTRAAIAEGARVALVDEALGTAFSDPALFSADRFHPSSAGYAVITEALLPAVRSALVEVTSSRSGN